MVVFHGKRVNRKRKIVFIQVIMFEFTVNEASYVCVKTCGR